MRLITQGYCKKIGWACLAGMLCCLSPFHSVRADNLQEIMINSQKIVGDKLAIVSKQQEIVLLDGYADLVDTILPEISIYVSSRFKANFGEGRSFEEYLSPIVNLLNRLLAVNPEYEGRRILELPEVGGYQIPGGVKYGTVRKGLVKFLTPDTIRAMASGLQAYGRARDGGAPLPLEVGASVSWDLRTIPVFALKYMIVNQKGRAAQALAMQAKQDQTNEAVLAYLDLAYQRQKIILTKEKFRYLKQLAERAQTRAAQGLLSKSDLASVKLGLLQAQEDLIQAQTSIKLAEELYLRKAGTLPTDMEMPDLPQLPATLELALQAMEKSHSQLSHLKQQINIAGSEADLAAVSLIPSFKLHGNASKAWSLAEKKTTDLRWSAGFSLNLSLLGSQGANYWSRTRALSKRSLHLSQYLDRHKELQLELAQTWHAWQTQEDMLRLLDKKLQLAEEKFSRAEAKWANNLFNMDKLIEAHLDITKVKMESLHARWNSLKHAFKIMYLIGPFNVQSRREKD